MTDTERTPEVLSAADVAELLGMHVQMVRKYAATGRLPAYRLPGGRTFRFFGEEILEFLKAHPVEVVDPVGRSQTGGSRLARSACQPQATRLSRIDRRTC